MDKILENALKDYRDEFGQDFDSSWTPTSDQDLADKLRASKLNFDSWRSRHERLWKALTAIALPISKLAPIASEATRSVFPLASPAVTGMLALVTTCEKVTTAYDYIEQMFIKLEDAVSRWRVESEHEIDGFLLERRQQIVLVIFSIITRSRKLLKKGRLGQFASRAILGEDKKTIDLMRELDDLIQSEDRARMTLSLANIRALWDKAIRSENTQLVEKLQSPAADINQALYTCRIEDKILGTGQWLKAEQAYQEWTAGESQFLVVLGEQGSGKTYLVTSIIEELIQRHHRYDAKANTSSMAFFYFEQGHDLLTMLKTMAYQIQKTNQDYRQHIIETLDQGDLYTAKETWTKLFLDFWNDQVHAGSNLVIVIDGLSNGLPGAVESFAQDMVKDLKKGSGYNIQLAISGKLQLLVDFDFIPRENFIEIDFKKNKEDITVYVDQGLSKHRRLRKGRPGERVEITKKIVEGSHGIFEWARLLLERCKEREPHRIRKLLENPPESLSDMTKSCFEKIMAGDDVDPAMLRTLLTWLTYSKRRLRFGEIYNAISLETGEEYSFLWRNIVYYLSTVVRWKSSRSCERRYSDIDNDDDDHVEVLEDEEKGWSRLVRNTWVFFGNSQIREHVINQSNDAMKPDGVQSQWPPPTQQAECDMMKTCIKTLQQERVTESRNRCLLLYPLHYMFSHLKIIDLATASAHDKTEIAFGLIWLFYKESGHYVMAIDGGDTETGGAQRFWQLWVETKENTRVVQTWLRWAIENDLTRDSEITKWMHSAVTSYKALFQPFANYARRKWFELDWSPKSFSEYNDWAKVLGCGVTFLLAYDKLNDLEEFPEHYQIWPVFEDGLYNAEDLLASAKKAESVGEVESALTLALTFNAVNRPNLSLEFAMKVPKEQVGHWAAAWYRSHAHASRLEYDQAFYWIKIAVKNNPHIRGNVDYFIALWMLRCGKAGNALQAARASYSSISEDEQEISLVAQIYLKCLSLHQEWQVIIKVARQLHEKPVKSLPYSELIRILSSGYSEVWCALGQAYMLSQSQYGKEFILGIIQGGMKLLSQAQGEYHQIQWLNSVAIFTCRYLENGPERGGALFAANVSRIQESRLLPDETYRARILVDTMSLYAEWMYIWALEQERTSDPRLADTVEVLEALSRDARQINMSLLTRSSKWNLDRVGFQYGRWLQTHSTPGDKRWMTFFREPLLEHLSMLDDQVPHNDLIGLNRAYFTLQMARDYKNASALLSLLLLQLEETARKIEHDKGDQKQDTRGKHRASRIRQSAKDDTSAQANLNASSLTSEAVQTLHVHSIQPDSDDDDDVSDSLALDMDLDIIYRCSLCDAMFYKVEAMFICQHCGVECCHSCLPHDPTHSIFGRSCGSHHEFVKTWPVSKEQKFLAAVKKEGRVGVRRTWLEGLRREWRADED